MGRCRVGERVSFFPFLQDGEFAGLYYLSHVPGNDAKDAQAAAAAAAGLSAFLQCSPMRAMGIQDSRDFVMVRVERGEVDLERGGLRDRIMHGLHEAAQLRLEFLLRHLCKLAAARRSGGGDEEAVDLLEPLQRHAQAFVFGTQCWVLSKAMGQILEGLHQWKKGGASR